VFIDGVLIPVCHLVNGRTIFQQARDTITYWHVELSEHTVLSAEGVPAESYLDTGNRSAFANGDAVIDLHPDFARQVWEARGCAPFVLNGRRMIAAKRRLVARANALGHATTDDPGLCMLVDGREVVVEADGRKRRVRLPASATNIHLRSRVCIPLHDCADTDDLRQLGVAIARLRLDGRTIELGSPALAAGWHAPEPDWRWSDGDGVIVAPGVRELEFELILSGTYWQDAGGSHERHHRHRLRGTHARAV
jgi:hypothetical protein